MVWRRMTCYRLVKQCMMISSLQWCYSIIVSDCVIVYKFCIAVFKSEKWYIVVIVSYAVGEKRKRLKIGKRSEPSGSLGESTALSPLPSPPLGLLRSLISFGCFTPFFASPTVEPGPRPCMIVKPPIAGVYIPLKL